MKNREWFLRDVWKVRKALASWSELGYWLCIFTSKVCRINLNITSTMIIFDIQIQRKWANGKGFARGLRIALNLLQLACHLYLDKLSNRMQKYWKIDRFAMLLSLWVNWRKKVKHTRVFLWWDRQSSEAAATLRIGLRCHNLNPWRIPVGPDGK